MTADTGLGLSQIGIAGAFLGGLLALLSPCAALLLPSFFAYSFGRGSTLAARTAVFYLGLATVLVPLGAGVGAIGALLTRYRSTVTLIGGVVMIVLGVVVVLGRGFTVPGGSRGLQRLSAGGAGIGSWLSVAALGALYGLAGFCAGPLLGAVLTVAAAGGSAPYGGLLMGIYALGMAVPLFVLALVWDRLRLGERRWLRGRELRFGPLRTHTVSLISGALFIAIGALFLLTGGTANLGGSLGVETEYQLQVWVNSVAAALSDVTVLFVLAVLGLAAMAIRFTVVARRARGTSGAERPGPAPAAGEQPGDARSAESSRVPADAPRGGGRP